MLCRASKNGLSTIMLKRSPQLALWQPWPLLFQVPVSCSLLPHLSAALCIAALVDEMRVASDAASIAAPLVAAELMLLRIASEARGCLLSCNACDGAGVTTEQQAPAPGERGVGGGGGAQIDQLRSEVLLLLPSLRQNVHCWMYVLLHQLCSRSAYSTSLLASSATTIDFCNKFNNATVGLWHCNSTIPQLQVKLARLTDVQVSIDLIFPGPTLVAVLGTLKYLQALLSSGQTLEWTANFSIHEVTMQLCQRLGLPKSSAAYIHEAHFLLKNCNSRSFVCIVSMCPFRKLLKFSMLSPNCSRPASIHISSHQLPDTSMLSGALGKHPLANLATCTLMMQMLGSSGTPAWLQRPG